MEGLLLSKILTVFGAGLLTSLSPCVYPMIPISLGYFGAQAESGRKLNVVLFFIGQVLTFTLLGVMAAMLGEIFGFSSQNPWIQLGIGTLLLSFGLASLFNFVPAFLQKTNNISFKSSKNNSFVFPILAGSGTALLASPCTTPVLGAVLIAISSSSQLATGTVYMFFYALGSTLIFLGLGLGIMSMKKLPRAGGWMKKIHTLSAILIIAASLFFIYNGVSFFIG